MAKPPYLTNIYVLLFVVFPYNLNLHRYVTYFNITHFFPIISVSIGCSFMNIWFQVRDVKICSQIAPNGTNLGLFKISFSTFWLDEPKCTKTDLKKCQICPRCLVFITVIPVHFLHLSSTDPQKIAN